MNEDALRALIRQAVARQLTPETPAARAAGSSPNQSGTVRRNQSTGSAPNSTGARPLVTL